MSVFSIKLFASEPKHADIIKSLRAAIQCQDANSFVMKYAKQDLADIEDNAKDSFVQSALGSIETRDETRIALALFLINQGCSSQFVVNDIARAMLDSPSVSCRALFDRLQPAVEKKRRESEMTDSSQALVRHSI